jgi:hypothetical protein
MVLVSGWDKREYNMQPSNLLKIKSLGEGWCDKDHVLLHACFQLLSDFVEEEIPKFPHVNWNMTDDRMNATMRGVQFDTSDKPPPENTRDIKKEFLELYDWWQLWKKEKQEEKRTSFEEDHALYAKENEMLKRLIDLRMYLWT